MDRRHHTKGSEFWFWTGWGYIVPPSLTLNKLLKHPEPLRSPSARPLLRRHALYLHFPPYENTEATGAEPCTWAPSSPHSPAPTPPSTRPLGPIPSCPCKHRASLDLLLTDTIVSSLYAASSHQQVNTNRFLPPRNEMPLSRLHIGLRFPLCPSAPFLGNYSKEVSLPCLQFSLKGTPEPMCSTVHTLMVTGPPAAALTTAPSLPLARLPSASSTAAAPRPLRGNPD